MLRAKSRRRSSKTAPQLVLFHGKELPDRPHASMTLESYLAISLVALLIVVREYVDFDNDEDK